MMRVTTPSRWWAVFLALLVVGCTATAPREPSAEQAIDDGVVTARVRAALEADPLTAPHEIDVETQRGSVHLSGFVEDDRTRQRALQLARSIKGVRQVHDAMDIRKAKS